MVFADCGSFMLSVLWIDDGRRDDESAPSSIWILALSKATVSDGVAGNYRTIWAYRDVTAGEYWARIPSIMVL